MMKRRLIIAGESGLSRDGLSRILESDALTVVGTVILLSQLLPMLRETARQEPDLILYDQPADDAHGLEALNEISCEFPRIGIVILADHASAADLDLAIRAGARGFLPKDISVAALRLSLQLIALGENLFAGPAVLSNSRLVAPEGGTGLDSHELRAPLSMRESEILECLEAGSPNKVIARKLGVAEATVKVHIKSVLRKINVTNRTQAAIWAMNHHVTGPQSVN
jgi:two-component system nitrate/nitrite response regulator NarL